MVAFGARRWEGYAKDPFCVVGHHDIRLPSYKYDDDDEYIEFHNTTHVTISVTRLQPASSNPIL